MARMRGTRRMTALLGGAVLLLSACGGGSGNGGSGNGSASGGGANGTLTIAVGTDMDTLDPAAQGSTGAMQREKQMVESLTAIDADGKVQPLLATSWESSKDGLTWTFTLRSGVKFQDGTDFNADAVKFSIDRLLNKDTTKARPDVMTVITKTTAQDATHVVFTLKQAYPAFPAAMSQPMAGIVSPASVTQDGNTAQKITHPVGTGPFSFVEQVTSDHLTLAANPTYWGGAPKYGKQVWRVVPEATTRLAMLKSGDAQMVFDPPPTELTSLKSDSAYSVNMMPLPQVLLMFMNEQSTQAPQLKDPKVRQALSLAINRQVLVDKLVDGAGTVADGPLPQSDFGYCQTPAGSQYDPDKSKQLLSEAGVSGLTLRMGSPNGRYLNDYTVAQAIVGDLQQVGVTAKLAPATDFPTYFASLYVPDGTKSEYDISMVALGSIFLDGGHALRSYLESNIPPNGYNGGYYTNATFEKQFTTQSSELDDTKRAADICDAVKTLVSDQAAAWTYQPLSPVVTAKSVTGVTLLPIGMADPSKASIG
jgi:peptide/nickel transport system substrate-binding protein